MLENENSSANNVVQDPIKEPGIEDSWERVNPAKLRKPPNPLLTRRRKQNVDFEMALPKKVSKLEEERIQHQKKNMILN